MNEPDPAVVRTLARDLDMSEDQVADLLRRGVLKPDGTWILDDSKQEVVPRVDS